MLNFGEMWQCRKVLISVQLFCLMWLQVGIGQQMWFCQLVLLLMVSVCSDCGVQLVNSFSVVCGRLVLMLVLLMFLVIQCEVLKVVFQFGVSLLFILNLKLWLMVLCVVWQVNLFWLFCIGLLVVWLMLFCLMWNIVSEVFRWLLNYVFLMFILQFLLLIGLRQLLLWFFSVCGWKILVQLVQVEQVLLMLNIRLVYGVVILCVWLVFLFLFFQLVQCVLMISLSGLVSDRCVVV